MNKIISTPILLIGFNRPEVIKQSLEYIRKAKPQKLYVTIDGPRADKLGEKELVDAVIKIVKDIDWECETHYKISDTNQGAEVTVSEGVSWVLDNEETVIVLEDDIIAPISFLNFAQDMLERYYRNENIYMISGGQFTPDGLVSDRDYTFSLYGHTGCGWAIWKRAWSNFDLKINDFDDFLKSDKLDNLVGTETEKKYWVSKIMEMKTKGAGNNNWDICWSYIRLKKQGYSIVPRVNLTSNIGVYGLHSRGETSDHFRCYDENFIARIHPEEIKQNIVYDNYHFKNHINKKSSLIKRAFGKILRTLKLK